MSLFFLQCPYCAKSFVSHEYVIAHLSRRHGEHTSQVNGMVISTVPPVKSVGAVTMETKPGMTEKEKNDLEEELQMIKLRLQKTERELQEEKKLTQSQVGVKCHSNWVSWLLCFHEAVSVSIVFFVDLEFWNGNCWAEFSCSIVVISAFTRLNLLCFFVCLFFYQRDKLTTENHNMDELRAMFDQWKAGEKAEQQVWYFL